MKKKVIKKAKPVKKTVSKKATPPKDIWTQERVSALYKLSANTPRVDKLPRGNGSTHRGEPHEWEWEGEPNMAPVCLGCNATGDYVEGVANGDDEGSIGGGDWFGDLWGGIF